MRTLEFSMEKPDGYEITTTDLKERYSYVEMPKHTIGFDGENVWMKSSGKAKYDGYDRIQDLHVFRFNAFHVASIYSFAHSGLIGSLR